MSAIVDNPEAYFEQFVPERSALLMQLEEEARRDAIPIIGPVVGELLFILAWRDVSVRYIGDSASARLSLGPEWTVRPSRELRDKLTELLGNNNVRLTYAPTRELN